MKEQVFKEHGIQYNKWQKFVFSQTFSTAVYLAHRSVNI